jgi:hypothetical protein
MAPKIFLYSMFGFFALCAGLGICSGSLSPQTVAQAQVQAQPTENTLQTQQTETTGGTTDESLTGYYVAPPSPPADVSLLPIPVNGDDAPVDMGEDTAQQPLTGRGKTSKTGTGTSSKASKSTVAKTPKATTAKTTAPTPVTAPTTAPTAPIAPTTTTKPYLPPAVPITNPRPALTPAQVAGP